MKTVKQKNKQQNKGTTKLLGKILTILIILLLSLISFAGIYTRDKNSMKNVIPEYKLGMDLKGARNIVIKVDDSTETKKYDSEGKLITEESSSEENTENNFTQVEEPVNNPELLTAENYIKVKEIIEQRLRYMQVEGALISLDEDTGEIRLEITENNNTDYIAQYTITKGEFKVCDSDTSEVLLTNADIKNAKVQYGTTESGTTVYLSIEFDKEGAKKLKNISNTYVSSKDSEGNTTTRKVDMKLDDQTIISTYFQEEINDGKIQLSMGTSTKAADIQNSLQQASNISVFLNTQPMPLTYTMEVNRFVYSDITKDTIKTIIIAMIIIALIMAVAMIVKYKKNGLMGVITNIGFVAILLIAIRIANVKLTLSGLFTVAIATIIEYIITMLIINEYNKKVDSEITSKNIKNLLIRTNIVLMPLLIMAITFALIAWEEIASVGMVLFWALLIMVLYNIVILSVKLFDIPKEKDIIKKKNRK